MMKCTKQWVMILVMVITAHLYGVVMPEIMSLGTDMVNVVSNYHHRYGFETGCSGYSTAKIMPVSWRFKGRKRYLLSLPVDMEQWGAHWRLVEMTSVGGVIEVIPEGNKAWELYCRDEQLMRLDFKDGPCWLLFFEGLHNGHKDGCGTLWYRFYMTEKGELGKTRIDGGVDELLTMTNVKSLKRLLPSFYDGKKATISSSKLHDRMNGVKTALGMEARTRLFLDHECTLRRRMPHRKPSIFYVIASDVNGDGVTDAYVSSDLEMISNGAREWTLYVGNGNFFGKPERPIEHLLNRELVRVENKVVAREDEFYSVTRMGFPTYVCSIVRNGPRREFGPYLNKDNVVAKERHNRNDEGVPFEKCLETANAVSGIKSLSDLFVWYRDDLLVLERIECETVKLGR